MSESLVMAVKAIDSFGFLCEGYGMDLACIEYQRKANSQFTMLLEGRVVRLRLTLEKGQLYLHAASTLYPEEWFSMLRIVKMIARKGVPLSEEAVNTDYWRAGRSLDAQFALAAEQLRQVYPIIAKLFDERDFEFVRLELRGYGRGAAGVMVE